MSSYQTKHNLMVSAQLMVSDDVTVDMCRSYMETADSPPIGDGSGGMAMANGEYAEFIRLLGQHKCYEQLVPVPTGPQSILFLNLVCQTLQGMDNVTCSSEAEIPIQENALNATMVQLVCQKVNSLILSTCEPTPPTTLAPFPPPSSSSSTNPPTLRPASASRSPAATNPPLSTPISPPTNSPILVAPTVGNAEWLIAPNLTMVDCQTALVQSDAEHKDDQITLDEYGTFLQIMGEHVCFVPDNGNYVLAREAVFAQLQCEVNNACQEGTTTINTPGNSSSSSSSSSPEGGETAQPQSTTTTGEDDKDDTIDLIFYTSNAQQLFYLCERSYTLALNAALCTTTTPAPQASSSPPPPPPPPPTTSPAPTSSPQPSTSQAPSSTVQGRSAKSSAATTTSITYRPKWLASTILRTGLLWLVGGWTLLVF
ncbi:hypothetical protein ACA910_009981 [Epithemia clementina (nom. ined.)]